MVSIEPEPDEPSVSIIVPNLNGGELAVKCIESLLKTDYANFRIVFVDNCSTDDSLNEIGARFGSDARLIILPLDRNYSFTCAVSAGFHADESVYVVLMNNDMIAEPGWLKELVKTYLADPTIGAVQAKLLRLDNPALLQYGGGLMNRLGFSRGRGVGKPEHQYNTADRIFFAAGACMLTSRNLMREVGLPDTSFLVFDDVDLGWRIRLRGYEALFVPTSRVMHRGSLTLDRSELREWRLVQLIYEHYAMILKNYSFRSIFSVLPSVLLLHFGRLILLIAQRDLQRAKCTFVGMTKALVLLRTIWAKRISVQEMRRVSDSRILSMMKELSPDPLVLVERDIRGLKLRLVSEGGRIVFRIS
jgi:GT2 family glycosyltransferase